MGCGCKTKTVSDTLSGEMINVISGSGIIVSILLFIISIIILPFLYPVIIWLLFKHFFIGGNTSIGDLVNFFNKKDIEDTNDKNIVNDSELDV